MFWCLGGWVELGSNKTGYLAEEVSQQSEKFFLVYSNMKMEREKLKKEFCFKTETQKS